MKTIPTVAIGLLAMLMTTTNPASGAGNVDLSTVPKRDRVQLAIYNSEELILVRETRAVAFKMGVTPGG